MYANADGRAAAGAARGQHGRGCCNCLEISGVSVSRDIVLIRSGLRGWRWQPGKPTYGMEESQVTLFGMGLRAFKKCAMHCERCSGAVLHEKYFGP